MWKLRCLSNLGRIKGRRTTTKYHQPTLSPPQRSLSLKTPSLTYSSLILSPVAHPDLFIAVVLSSSSRDFEHPILSTLAIDRMSGQSRPHLHTDGHLCPPRCHRLVIDSPINGSATIAATRTAHTENKAASFAKIPAALCQAMIGLQLCHSVSNGLTALKCPWYGQDENGTGVHQIFPAPSCQP